MIAKMLVLRVDGKSLDTIPYTDEISERKKTELKDWKYRSSNDIEDAWQNSYDDSGWETVSLPHSWVKTTGQRKLKYTNAWYRTRFKPASRKSDHTVYVFFERAAINADVFVNGKRLGNHKGACNSFIFNATDALLPDQENILAVKVDNNTDLQAMPADFYGGLLGKVHVIITRKQHIDPTHFASPGFVGR